MSSIWPVAFGVAVIGGYLGLMALLMRRADRKQSAERKEALDRHERRGLSEMERRIREAEREIAELGEKTRNSLLREALRRSQYQTPKEP